MHIKKILVAVDTATIGTDVLPIADELARCTRAAVLLVSVADIRGVGVSEASPPVQVTTASLRQEAQAMLESAAQLFKSNIRPMLIVREGFPEKELVAAAHDSHADLLVMGTHGRTGLAHMFKGSVAESVLHHAPCPVLIVKIGEPR